MPTHDPAPLRTPVELDDAARGFLTRLDGRIDAARRFIARWEPAPCPPPEVWS